MADPTHLVVLHYHLRPGGVRRVIEIALPALADEMGLRAVTLATGESAEPAWLDALAKRMPGVELRVCVEPAFGYTSERRCAPGALRERIRNGVRRLPSDAGALWFHNPSLARNVPLVEAVNAEVLRRSIPAIYHHHDLWVDHRWSRWPELRALGYRTLEQVARVVFPAHVFHATINQLDREVFTSSSAHRVGWMPNPVMRGGTPGVRAVRDARRWLSDRLGSDAPVWIFPTRLLRRKNLAEAVLLTRWLRPGAACVTTAGVSSQEEGRYARRLQTAARENGWLAAFGAIADAPDGAPDVAALVAASEAMLLTSVQEGFGLPYIEAVAAGKPLIARSLPNVAPDLRRMGFRLAHLYDEVWIDREMFDCSAERKRQEAVWKNWRDALPGRVRTLAQKPVLLGPAAGPVAFSRLTLAAQLEVLALPADEAWKRCVGMNPVLARAAGKLLAAEWPERAGRSLAVERYAARFREALGAGVAGATDDDAAGIQRAFIEQRLGSGFLFPILIE